MADAKYTRPRHFGSIKQKLAKMLSDKGYEVEFFKEPLGWWRSAQADLDFRWEADVYKPDGGDETYTIGSFLTMTECVRKGFTIKNAGAHFHTHYVVDAAQKAQGLQIK